MDYTGERQAPVWLTTTCILDCFGKGKSAGGKYRAFVEDLIDREYESPLNGAAAATILGGAEFIDEITARHIDGKPHGKDLPAVRQLSPRPTMDAIITAVEELSTNDNMAKKTGMYLCRNYSGARLKEIGERYGIGESGVSKASRRFSREMERNSELRKLVERIGAKLNLSKA